MTEAVESLRVLRGALGGGERGVEDVERGDWQLTLHLRREEQAAPECFPGHKQSMIHKSAHSMTYLRSRSLALLMDFRSSSVISAGCWATATLTNNNSNNMMWVQCPDSPVAHMSGDTGWRRMSAAWFYTQSVHIHGD